MSQINFFLEEIKLKIHSRQKIKNWIKSVIEMEKRKLSNLNIIFCTDHYLLEINQQYLNHDTFTDIITFDHKDEMDSTINGDIFISVERVSENASRLNINFEAELNRVIIHGVLHLIGYSDKTKKDKNVMRDMEDNYLKYLDVPRGTFSLQ